MSANPNSYIKRLASYKNIKNQKEMEETKQISQAIQFRGREEAQEKEEEKIIQTSFFICRRR